MINKTDRPMTPAQERTMLLDTIKDLQGALKVARERIENLQHQLNHFKGGANGHPHVRD